MPARSHPSSSTHPSPSHPTRPLVAIVGTRYREHEIEERALLPLGARLRVCWDPEQALDATLVLAGSAAHYPAEVLERMPGCRAIVRYGVGLDRIDVEAAGRLGIAVHNVVDFCTEEVSGHAVAMILAFSRRLLDGARALAAGGWGLDPLRPVRAAEDEVVSVIGSGRIGSRAAEKLRALGYRVVVHDLLLAPRPSLEEALQGADYVTLHVPLTADTHHLLDRRRLDLLAPGAVVVNTSRGGLIDESALIAALDSGRLRGAALDVFEAEPLPPDSPLRSRPDVLLTPHMAWYSERAERTVRERAVARAVELLRR
jgi:D-3-phosphoglycerate dehydrogenase